MSLLDTEAGDNMHDIPPTFLTPNDVVEQSGRSRDHVHKALNSKALKATQAYRHGSWQITPQDLADWIAAGRPAKRVDAEQMDQAS